jgi:hypothetical protein
MMCFRFFANDVFIGTSTLLGRDPAMGVLFGTFIPAPGYKTVQDAHFVLRGVECERRADAREGIVLRLFGGDIEIRATSIYIYDFTNDLDEDSLEIQVIGAAPEAWEAARCG